MPALRTPIPGRVPSVGGPLSRDVPFRYAGCRPPPASGGDAACSDREEDRRTGSSTLTIHPRVASDYSGKLVIRVRCCRPSIFRSAVGVERPGDGEFPSTSAHESGQVV